MKIKRIDEMLAIYDENFPDRSEMYPRLEVILAQALLVVIYSEFEKRFKNIVVKRFSLARDRSLEKLYTEFQEGINQGVKT